MNEYLFRGLNESVTLYVKASEVERYKEVFSGSILPLEEYHTDLKVPILSISQPYPIYNLQGVRIDQPKKGVYIQNGKKVIVK